MNKHDAKLRKDLSEVLTSKDLNQSDVAEMIEKSKQYTSDIFTGRRGKLPKSITAIFDALNLELYVREKPSTTNDQKS